MDSLDGWIPSNDVWVYASANSFTINGVDRTAAYTSGTRIKCTNNSTTFYGVVVSSSFSTDTTVTLAPNNDYSLANSTITLPSYSYVENPQGYPYWFNYTPTFGGFSSDPTLDSAKFSLQGKLCTFFILCSANGTSNATTLTMTAPLTNGQMRTALLCGQAIDNGAVPTDPTLALLAASSTTIDFYRTYAGTGWVNSGAKRIIELSGFYSI